MGLWLNKGFFLSMYFFLAIYLIIFLKILKYGKTNEVKFCSEPTSLGYFTI